MRSLTHPFKDRLDADPAALKAREAARIVLALSTTDAGDDGAGPAKGDEGKPEGRRSDGLTAEGRLELIDISGED